MTEYKYLAYGQEPETDNDREIYMTGLLDDSHAVDKAKEDEDAITDEDGNPFVYRENKPTSTFGCGHSGCIACNGWILLGEAETVHGEPKQ